MNELTQSLIDVQDGKSESATSLMPQVYDELRRYAQRVLAGERNGHTLQPTALVNEAFLHLIDATQITWKGRAHFRAVAAICMRRILVDHARRRGALKRGGGLTLGEIEQGNLPAAEASIDVLEIDEALTQLGAVSPLGASIVESKFFGRLTDRETAETLGVSERTVRREWTTARAWLRDRLERNRP